jgi:hypothetical protein
MQQEKQVELSEAIACVSGVVESLDRNAEAASNAADAAIDQAIAALQNRRAGDSVVSMTKLLAAGPLLHLLASGHHWRGATSVLLEIAVEHDPIHHNRRMRRF